MKCYPLGVAGLLAVACDCIRRGDLDGAQAALARASALARGGGTPAHDPGGPAREAGAPPRGDGRRRGRGVVLH